MKTNENQQKIVFDILDTILWESKVYSKIFCNKKITLTTLKIVLHNSRLMEINEHNKALNRAIQNMYDACAQKAKDGHISLSEIKKQINIIKTSYKKSF